MYISSLFPIDPRSSRQAMQFIAWDRVVATLAGGQCPNGMPTMSISPSANGQGNTGAPQLY